MAMELEGFSIREYVSKMREADVAKSWPFSNDDEEVNVADFLPPITVTKFRWWSHALDLARSKHDDPSVRKNGEEVEILTRIEVDLSNTSEKLELDSPAPAAAEKKRKTVKQPKKRSITEIFAVAPPIHKIEEEKLKKRKKKIKLKKKISKKNVTITKKKNLKKFKQQIEADANISERFSNEISDAVFVRKCESIKKKQKEVQTSKILRKKLQPLIPYGILKKKTSKILKKRDSDANPCKIYLPEKHVKFTAPKLQSKSIHTDSTSSEKDYSLEINRKLSNLESSGNDEDVSFGSENRFEAQSLNEFDNWDCDDNTPIFTSQEKIKNSLPQNRIGLNNDKLPMIERDPPLSEETPRAIPSRTLFALNERYDSRDSNTGNTMVDPTAYMQSFLKPSLPSKVQSLSQTTQYEPFCNSFHNEIMGNNLHSFPKKKPGRDFDEGFYGLPLNSQGELIKLNPKDKIGTNWNNVDTITGCSTNLPRYKHSLMESTNNLFEENRKFHNYFEENRNFHTQFPRESEFTNAYKKTDQTMRLMGKDLTIGRTSKDSDRYENEKIWTDKEIITRPVNIGTENSVNQDFYQDWILNSQKDARISHIQSLFQTQAPNFGNFHCHSQNPGPLFSTLFNQRPPFIPQNTCKHTHFNFAETRYNHSLPQSSKSAFDFPFLHPDRNRHFEPSWFPESSRNLPPWLLHASQEKESYIHHPYTQSSFKSVENTGFTSKYNPKEKLKSKPFSSRNLDMPYKSRKRNAVNFDDSSKRRSKIPNLGMQETDGLSFLRRDMNETTKGSLGNSLPGPHKLSAGVKHILKPNQCIDQDNSTLTHSTIHAPSINIHEIQKSAKIYRF